MNDSSKIKLLHLFCVIRDFTVKMARRATLLGMIIIGSFVWSQPQAPQVSAPNSSVNAEAHRTQIFKNFLIEVEKSHPLLSQKVLESFALKAEQLKNKLAASPAVQISASQIIEPWSRGSGEGGTLRLEANIFKFGADLKTFQVGHDFEKKAEINNTLARIEIQRLAAEAYFSWLEIANTFEYLENLVRNRKLLLKLAEERYRRGELPLQELDKARLENSNSEIELRRAEIQRLQLTADLETFSSLISAIKEWPWQAIKVQPKNLQKRFSYLQLAIDKEVLKNQAWMATSGWLPSLDIVSQWHTNSIDPFRNGEWSSSLVLSIPIWDRAQTLSQRRTLLLQSEAKDFEMKNFELNEGARLKTLSARIDKLKQNRDQALVSARSSQKIAADSLRRFQMGRSSINDLILDQSRVYSAEVLSQQTQAEYHRALLELCLSADEKPSDCF